MMRFIFSLSLALSTINVAEARFYQGVYKGSDANRKPCILFVKAFEQDERGVVTQLSVVNSFYAHTALDIKPKMSEKNNASQPDRSVWEGVRRQSSEQAEYIEVKVNVDREEPVSFTYVFQAGLDEQMRPIGIHGTCTGLAYDPNPSVDDAPIWRED